MRGPPAQVPGPGGRLLRVMVLSARIRRRVVITVAGVCLVWTAGMPLLGQKLYPTPKQQPHGAAKYVFYCHVI
jgi:hypothetical protein